MFIFVLHILCHNLLGTNRPEGWVRTDRKWVQIVQVWARTVRVRKIHAYETIGIHFYSPPHRYGMLVHRRVTPKHYICHYLFIHLGVKGTLRVKYLAQEHKAVPRPGLEPRPLNLESSALTITPPCLSHCYEKCVSHIIEHSRTRNQSAVTHLCKNFPERSIHYVIYPD